MTYRLGVRSRLRLAGVDRDLVRVVKRAIQITDVDFTVLEGLRTVERQKKLVKSGASKTMASRHITGDAVDLGAYQNGSVVWHWPLYIKIAKAMQAAAKELDVRIEWGGCWSCINDESDLERAMARYISFKRSEGKKSFLDGPHFQVSR